MIEPVVLIDAGNTLIKWVAFERRDTQFDANAIQKMSSTVIHSGLENSARSLALDLCDALKNITGLPSAAERTSGYAQPVVCWSSVLGSSFNHELQQCFDRMGWKSIRPLPGLDLNFETRYEDPSSLGQDRWVFSWWVSQVAERSSNLAVSFGTATTVDWVYRSSGAQASQAPSIWIHEGGVIFPGVQLMSDALHQRTAQLPIAELSEVRWPQNTGDAIGAGILACQSGAIRVLVERANAQSGQVTDLWVTGGHALDLGASGQGRVHRVEHAVLRGLNLAIQLLNASR